MEIVAILPGIGAVRKCLMAKEKGIKITKTVSLKCSSICVLQLLFHLNEKCSIYTHFE